MSIVNATVSTFNLQLGKSRDLTNEREFTRPEKKEKRTDTKNDFETTMAAQYSPEPPKEKSAKDVHAPQNPSPPQKTDGTKEQTAAETPAPSDDSNTVKNNQINVDQRLTEAEMKLSQQIAAASTNTEEVPKELTAMLKNSPFSTNITSALENKIISQQKIQPKETSVANQGGENIVETAPAPPPKVHPPWMVSEKGEDPGSEVEFSLPKKGAEKTLTNPGHQTIPENNVFNAHNMPTSELQSVPINAAPPLPIWQTAQVNLPEIIDQVRVHILQGSKAGDKRVTLQLQPPELGKVNIELSLSDKQIEARIYTEHQAVREVILSQIEQLRAQLAQDGWNLSKVDVNIGTFQEQQNQRAQNGLFSFRTGHKGRSGASTGNLAAVDSPLREWQPPGLGRRINIIA